MRSMLLMSCVAAAAAGCETTRHSTVNCTPCKTHKTSCLVSPGAPAPAAAPGKPVALPPTIKEVRSEEAEPRQFASTMPTPQLPAPAPVQPPVANQGDVLLIPRWVYVPYSPHTPNGPSKMPAHVNALPTALPYMQADDRMTVLPPMGATPAPQANPNQAAMMMECLQQMKMLNQRMTELEAKNAPRPAPAVAVPTVVPAASTPQMLPLPPPLPVPMIPAAK